MKKSFFVLIVLLSLHTSGCYQQRGPVTHAQAFFALKEAYQSGNNSALSALLTQNSHDYIKKIALAISRLETSSKQHMAQKLGIEEKALENVSSASYMKLYLELNSSYSKDTISHALEKDVISIDETETKATYKMANQVTLHFVREEPYWKFDLERSVR